MKVALLLSLVSCAAFPLQSHPQTSVYPPIFIHPAVGPSITFPNPGQQFVGASISVPVRASAGPPVTLSSETSDVCTVSGLTVSFLAKGTCTLTASQQSSDPNLEVATPVTQTFNVDPMYLAKAMLSRSLLASGDPSRLQRMIQKARAGGPVTIACIGGSITAGGNATDHAHRYVDRLASWWSAAFPRSSVTIVDAGISATASPYGALRVRRDVLSANPDLVVVEFAVNDPASPAQFFKDAYEGLVRQLLDWPQHPAVILLFMMKYALPINEATATAQGWQSPVGVNYNVPMVSYFDAIAPELTSGRLSLSEMTNDGTHPTNLGHAYVGLFLANAIQNVIDGFPEGTSAGPIPPTANALYSTDFEFTTLQDGIGGEGAPLDPVTNQGWTAKPAGTDLVLGRSPEGLESSAPGSTLDFDIRGDQILVGYMEDPGAVGQISVSVDGQSATVIDPFDPGKPGGFRRLAPVLLGGAKTVHQVHIELLNSPPAGSSGTTFRVLCMGSGGAE